MNYATFPYMSMESSGQHRFKSKLSQPPSIVQALWRDRKLQPILQGFLTFAWLDEARGNLCQEVK